MMVVFAVGCNGTLYLSSPLAKTDEQVEESQRKKQAKKDQIRKLKLLEEVKVEKRNQWKLEFADVDTGENLFMLVDSKTLALQSGFTYRAEVSLGGSKGNGEEAEILKGIFFIPSPQGEQPLLFMSINASPDAIRKNRKYTRKYLDNNNPSTDDLVL